MNNYIHFGLALVFVIGLILLAAWAARRFDLGHLAGRAIGRRNRRLAIVEILPLDSSRRLVLVRRDEIHHLLLIGGASELVVECGIGVPRFSQVLAESENPSVGTTL
ncbi:MAG: flagellar biosynthetic protein FliO [Alphaproteobacteria bacterium]|nr:flagellar biosynthetic protein FliO [Alphaproteobacteria bacterium]